MANFIGTAGWALPREAKTRFPKDGAHLERYSRVLDCVEINSSFYRSHSTATYQRWSASTPPAFRFSVKMPRTITHDAELRRSRKALEQFLGEVEGLGKKLGPLLIQLPPSMAFEARVAIRFFTTLRELYRGPLVCEPRHATWFKARATDAMIDYRISRVAADPSKIEGAETPGAAMERLRYYRFHGSPRIYWSNYSDTCLSSWAKAAHPSRSKTDTWFVFDNTAAGCATLNALHMKRIIAAGDKS